MKFTLVFENNQEGSTANYDLLFVPSPVWHKGDNQIINLISESPIYQKGGLKKLIEVENLHNYCRCLIVIHDIGHGGNRDLDILVEELEEAEIDFAVTTFEPKMNSFIITSKVISAFSEVCNNIISSVEESKDGTENNNRSSEFIHKTSISLKYYVEKIYKNKKIVALSRTEDNAKDFRKKEILFDVNICEYSTFQSLDNDITVHYLIKSFVQIESEFERTIQYSIEDFNKLICGNAEVKIMVLPFNVEAYHNEFKLLAQNIMGELYLIYLPQPKLWRSQVKDDFKVFKYERNDWLSITEEIKRYNLNKIQI